jgi:hypothetical protein
LLAPTGDVILHEQAVATLDGSRVDYESWQLSSAPYSYRRIKGATETSYGGSTIDSYDPPTNTITEQPASAPQQYDDPVAAPRQLLRTGDAAIVATTTLNGRRVYEISAHSTQATLDGTIYVDASTCAPVRAELPGPETIDFLAYEQLPVDYANRTLLSVTGMRPNAAVVAAPSRASAKPAPSVPRPRPPADRVSARPVAPPAPRRGGAASAAAGAGRLRGRHTPRRCRRRGRRRPRAYRRAACRRTSRSFAAGSAAAAS